MFKEKETRTPRPNKQHACGNYAEPTPKVKEMLETISPPAERQTKQRKPFQKPTSEEEWRSFHKMNEEGIKKRLTKAKKATSKTATSYMWRGLGTFRMCLVGRKSP